MYEEIVVRRLQDLKQHLQASPYWGKMAGAKAPPNGIVYLHYKESPYARRVAWYLAFRQIAYAECVSLVTTQM